MNGTVGVELVGFGQRIFALIERKMVEERALLHRGRSGESLTLQSTSHLPHFLGIVGLSTVWNMLEERMKAKIERRDDDNMDGDVGFKDKSMKLSMAVHNNGDVNFDGEVNIDEDNVDDDFNSNSDI